MRYRSTPAAFAIGGISLSLLVVTLLSYPLVGHGPLSSVLFWLGMGGEINVGAWWSGMLFLLAAVLALECAADARRSVAERRGWAAFAAAFTALSFDEIASLHEFITARDDLYLIPFGALGFGLVAYAFVSLRRAGVPLRAFWWAFALLASVPLQELAQWTLEWNNAWLYGLRAFVEEGTEVAAALLLIAGTYDRAARASDGRTVSFAALLSLGPTLSLSCAAALPVAALAAYAADFRGPGNWLGAALFLLCALLAARHPREPVRLSVYLLASIGANAVPVVWSPLVLGVEVNLRALSFGLLLAAAPWLLSRSKSWRRRTSWLVFAAPTLAGSCLFPAPLLVWSVLPPAIALLCFHRELLAARAAAGAVLERGTMVADDRQPAGQP